MGRGRIDGKQRDKPTAGSAAPFAEAGERGGDVTLNEVPPVRGVPETEVVARPKRRVFSAEYRLRIVEEADRCKGDGDIGRLLRRENLNSSHLANWRRARRESAFDSMKSKRRGPKVAEANPLAPKVRRLEAEVRRLERVLVGARARVEVRREAFKAVGRRPLTREALLKAARAIAPKIGIDPARRVLGVSRSTFYRRANPAPKRRKPRPKPPNALSDSERQRIMDVLASPRFRGRSPRDVVAILRDEGRYMCSERTMYRILKENRSSGHRNKGQYKHLADARRRADDSLVAGAGA